MNTETIDLPIEAFSILIRSVAQGIINELDRKTATDFGRETRPQFLHEQVGRLNELVGKFEILHNKETEPNA